MCRVPDPCRVFARSDLKRTTMVCRDRSFSDSYDRGPMPIGPFVPCLDNPPTTPDGGDRPHTRSGAPWRMGSGPGSTLKGSGASGPGRTLPPRPDAYRAVCAVVSAFVIDG